MEKSPAPEENLYCLELNLSDHEMAMQHNDSCLSTSTPQIANKLSPTPHPNSKYAQYNAIINL